MMRSRSVNATVNTALDSPCKERYKMKVVLPNWLSAACLKGTKTWHGRCVSLRCDCACHKTGRDYPEDASHENGAYMNKCSACGFTFVGHKRRTVCKVCFEGTK